MMRAVRPGSSDEMGAGFVNCNRNKDCIALNLKAMKVRISFINW